NCFLLRPVRHRSDVHVEELGAAFAPVAVREDVKPSHFTARLDLASMRHCPVKERIEASDALACLQRLDMFEEGGEAAYHFACVQRLRHVVERLQRNTRLCGTSAPEVADEFVRLDFTLQRGHHAPIELAEHDLRRVLCLRRNIHFAAWLHPLAPDVTDAEGEDTVRGHHAEMF